MAAPSPALYASTMQTGLIDPHRPAEYPIILGDSLKEASAAKAYFVNARYNHKPKQLSQHSAKITEKAAPGYKYELSMTSDEPYRYRGKPSHDSTNQDLVLVFDPQKAAFTLEKISSALDFNLVAAPGKTREEIQSYPQLASNKPKVSDTGTETKSAHTYDNESDKPDPSNPYDYRHFLAEAKANLESHTSTRTPLPSALSSPVPTASRFHGSSTTPLHRAAAPTSAPVKRRRLSDARPTPQSAQKPKPKPKPKTTANPKTLSKERISDSDDELSDSALPTAKPKQRGGYAPSPRIEVDEAADLVIDMGSPPPPSRRPMSRLGTSSAAAAAGGFGRSPFQAALSRLTQSSPLKRRDSEHMREDGEGDTHMQEDGDVEEFELGSPRRGSKVQLGGGAEDEDEDDELAAELEAALEDDEEEEEGIGLGIQEAGTGGKREEEEEEEVSEEE